MVFDESHKLGFLAAADGSAARASGVASAAWGTTSIAAWSPRCNLRVNVDGQVSAARTLHHVPTGPNGLTGFVTS